MKSLIANITGGYSASAKVVDGTLVLSLPDAITPVVWQMDLSQVRASAIEVRGADNGQFVLALKTPKGDVNDIAPYQTRAKAVHALMAITRAMENAHGAIRPAAVTATTASAEQTVTAAPAPYKKPTSGGQILAALGGLALVIFLIMMLMRMNGPLVAEMSGEGMATRPSSATLSSGGGSAPAGEPVSADDFLRNR